MAQLIIAITGGVASGKSAVASAFEALGRTVVDADQLARELVAPGQPALARIWARFGDRVLDADGRLDRAWLRDHVFAQPDARRDLEAILHPLIRAELKARAEAAPGPYALVAVPLLTEGGRVAYPWLQRILLVDVPVELQRRRLLARDGGDPAQAQGILDAQASRAQRLALADDVIVNDGPWALLTAAVGRLDRRYREASAIIAGFPTTPDESPP